MNPSILTLAAMAGAFVMTSVDVKAASLKVLAGGSMTASLKELAPRFEKATGHKLDIAFAGTPDLIKQATSGAPFDAGVVPIDVMKNEAARAKFAATQPATIARVGYGVAVKAGAPKPDISTAAKFKDAMLKARSITLYPESAAGAFVVKTFEMLGIADAMKAKLKAQSAPTGIAPAVAAGEAEYGVFLTNVLIAPGVEPAGPFPGDLQNELVFVGAVAADSRNAAAAQAFLDYLRTPDAAALFKAKGVTPG
jgi:molybdate transport system substrate-binding protein